MVKCMQHSVRECRIQTDHIYNTHTHWWNDKILKSNYEKKIWFSPVFCFSSIEWHQVHLNVEKGVNNIVDISIVVAKCGSVTAKIPHRKRDENLFIILDVLFVTPTVKSCQFDGVRHYKRIFNDYKIKIV